jgi:type I restriction enzyme M protein
LERISHCAADNRGAEPSGAQLDVRLKNPSTSIQVRILGGLFVDTRDRNRRDYGMRKIVRVFSAGQHVERYARHIGLDEIARNDSSMNISGYIETTMAAEMVEVAMALAKLREAEKQRAEADVRMKRFLRELGYGG